MATGSKDFAAMDAAELIAANDAYRRADVEDGPGSGLVRLDEWARSGRFGKYVPAFPTVAPRGWASAAPLTQREYTAKIAARFPEVVALVRSTANVCIAGGAAAWPLLDAYDVGDVDLFIYGMHDAPDAARWAKVCEVAEKVRAAFADARFLAETMSEGLVTFEVLIEHPTVRDVPDARRKMQLVLRGFRSRAAILYGFDVPACSVCFDGDVTLMTPLAASALLYRAMVVHPAYQSPSFAHRLAKYFRRGLALVFVHMRPDALRRGEPLALGRFGLSVTPRLVHGRFAFGDVDVAAAAASDYEPEPPNVRARYPARFLHPRRVHATVATNVAQLTSGKRRFVVAGCDAPSRAGPHTRLLLPFERYAAREPTFADVLPRAAVERLADAAVRGAVANGKLNVVALRRVFALSDAELAAVVVAAARAVDARAGRISAERALAPFKAAVLAAYDATPAAIGWWIVADPSRQFTVTRDPAPETPREWYGAAFVERPEPPSKDETIDALLARLSGDRDGGACGDDATYSDGTCALCFGNVAARARDSVTLACGHTFHFAGTPRSECSGLVAWLEAARPSRAATCPTCRRSIGAPAPEAAEPRAYELDVAWLSRASAPSQNAG